MSSAFHPVWMTAVPEVWKRSVTPGFVIAVMMVVTDEMWSSCQAASRRRQTRSYIFFSSPPTEERSGGVAVGMIAWWSVTLESSTKRLPSGRSPVPGASSSR